jgi:uroporphyrinogen decarboxylase
MYAYFRFVYSVPHVHVVLFKSNTEGDSDMNMTQHNDKTPVGIHSLVPRERMSPGARKLRDTYARIPNAPLYHREFYIWDETLARWAQEGMPQDVPQPELFGWDTPGSYSLGQLGWCEAEFAPQFKVEILEDRGETELVRDFAGRHVLYFKGRRHGFMPEYVDHPVKDMKTWTGDVKWRMNPDSPERFAELHTRMNTAKAAAGEGRMIVQNLVGGYMYLRSLIGPEHLLYAFYDMPELIHDCMKTWFNLADAVIARHQQHVTIDEIFFAEDICYNHGSLISPDMMTEFLLPYYQQLITNLRGRQLDRSRHLYIQVDTDGLADPVIPIYRDGIGMNMMSPFEVASGSDVLATRKTYPDLIISGGIDKRILAHSKSAIDGMVENILPRMRAAGGYIPTCDHGVPVEVSYENYLHYRQRCIELGG